MSWTDPSVSKGKQLIRRVYYLRATSGTPVKTFSINDQLPMGQVFRVSATGQISSTSATTITETQTTYEVRLYDAFNIARTYDATNPTPAAIADPFVVPFEYGSQYIILGTCVFAPASTAIRNMQFTPADPVQCSSFNDGQWTIVLYSVDSTEIAVAADVGGWSFQIDVRGGGVMKFAN